MSEPTISELKQTCSACPSQWEGKLSDGRIFYVRYRHGILSIGFGDTLDAAVDDTMRLDAPEYDIGGEHDGRIEWSKVLPYFNREIATEAKP